MSKKAQDLILACKPYKGGDDVLWHLHELNRREKHRLLVTVGGFVDNWGITQHIEATDAPLEHIERLGRAYASDETWTQIRLSTFPLKAGDVLLVDPPNSKINKNIKFGVEVAIYEPGICDAEPLIAVLHASIDGTWRVIQRFAGMY